MIDRKISELTELITPAVNDLLPIVDVSVDGFETKYVTVTNLVAGAVGAPSNAEYVTLALHIGLTDERVLVGTANQIVITDGGAGGNVTLSTPQDIHVGASPTFAGLTINGNITVTGTVDGVDIAGIADAQYVVIAADGDLANERILTGTANQVIVTDGGAGGNVTLSTPQDIAVGSSPTFAGLTINGNITVTGTIDGVDLAGIAAAQFVTIVADANLANERILTGTANQIVVTDGGAGAAVTLSTPQDIDIAATPTFGNLTINGNITVTGTVDGVDIAALGTTVTNLIAPQYVTLAVDATLTNERVLTGTANQIIITDAGAGLAVTLSTPQNIHAAATPTFGGLTINGNVGVTGTVDGVDIAGANAAQYVTLAIDANLPNERVLTGTANQIVITDNGAGGTVVLSTPQDIHTGASPTFVGMTFSGLTASRLIATDGAKALTSSDLFGWIAGTANQIIVTDDLDGTVTLSSPQDLAAASSPVFAGLTINGNIGVTGTVDGVDIAGANAAQYVTIALNANLANERVLTGTANQITVTDGGAGGAVTLSLPQDIDTSADVTFDSLVLDDLTALRLVASDAGEKLVSTDLFAWVAGTANRVTVADDADGTITLSGPQDIAAASSPAFAGLTINGNITVTGTVDGVDVGALGTTVTNLIAPQYVTLALDATLTNERVLTGTANQIIITDNGAGGTVVLSTPQDTHTGAIPQFAGLGIGGAGGAGNIVFSAAATISTAAGILTIDGAAEFVIQDQTIIDITSIEALVIRKNGDGGDVVIVDTTNVRMGVGVTPVQQLQIAGNFRMPASTATTGIIYRDANTFIHTFANRNSTFVGDQAGNLTNATQESVGIGFQCLTSITSGVSDMALGAQALADLTEGSRDVAIGNSALRRLVDGNDDVAIGNQAAQSLVDGDAVVAIGTIALRDCTASGGVYSVAIGFQAMFATTLGIQLVGIGKGAGDTNTVGSDCTWIGFESDNSANNLSKTIAIGYRATAGASNVCVLGGTGSNAVRVGVGGVSVPLAQMHIDQLSATANIPVLLLDQADDDVVLLKVIATAAAASANRTLVADADFGSPGALVGWIQIEIEDIGNRIADADYWMPFYAVPT